MKTEVDKPATFHVFQGINGKWYYQIKHGNGKKMVASQGYTRVSDAQRACRALQAVVRGYCLMETDHTPNKIWMKIQKKK